MEKELFDWEGWDQGSDTAKIFYEPILKVDIGQFKAGTKFSSASIDDASGELSFYNDGIPIEDSDGIPSVLVGRFQLKYQIIKDLLNDE